eukprot:5904204-Alexandrium_andersonii.AAC.1
MACQFLNTQANMAASVASTTAMFRFSRRKNNHAHGLAAGRARSVRKTWARGPSAAASPSSASW